MNFVAHRSRMPRDCGILACSIALPQDYEYVRFSMRRHLEASGQIDWAVMDAYLVGWRYVKADGKHRLDQAPLPAGRLLAFTELYRDRAWIGHYCAVINGDLHDHSDTRDGRLLGYWRRF